MKNLILFLVILIYSNPVTSQTLTKTDTKTIITQLNTLDKDINDLLEKFHTAGVAVAVIKDNKTIFTKGYGYRNVDEKLPVNENTIFGIGSCTKAFVAATLGILEGQDKLKLSDRPSKHIPSLKFYNSAMDEAIQIRNLLNHSTGIANNSSESSAIFFQSPNINDLIPRLKYLEPAANVGERFLYSNYMYTIAAIVSERITGKSWADNVSDLIFKPLDMNHSYIRATNAIKSSNFSLGYSVSNNKITTVLGQNIPTIAAAGEIHSSVKDMAKWVNVWLQEGKYQDKTILPIEYLKAAISPQQIMGGGPKERFSDEPLFFNYGYGWMSKDFMGYYRVEHSGAVSGYTSNVVFFPTEKIGIVVLSNQSNSSISYSITDLITDQLFEIKQEEKRESEIRFTTVDKVDIFPPKTTINEDQKPSHSLESFTGKYSHPGFGELSISYTDGTLYATFPFTALSLSHDSNNSFTSHYTKPIPTIMTGGCWLYFTFVENETGQVSGIQINMSAEGVVFSKLNK